MVTFAWIEITCWISSWAAPALLNRAEEPTVGFLNLRGRWETLVPDFPSLCLCPIHTYKQLRPGARGTAHGFHSFRNIWTKCRALCHRKTKILQLHVDPWVSSLLETSWMWSLSSPIISLLFFHSTEDWTQGSSLWFISPLFFPSFFFWDRFLLNP